MVDSLMVVLWQPARYFLHLVSYSLSSSGQLNDIHIFAGVRSQ